MTAQIPLNEATELAKDRTAVIYHHNIRRRGGHDEEIRWSRKFDVIKVETIGNVEKTDLCISLGGLLTTS